MKPHSPTPPSTAALALAASLGAQAASSPASLSHQDKSFLKDAAEPKS